MAATTTTALVLLIATFAAAGDALALDLHHRFSDRLRRWTERRSAERIRWPEQGTVDYYAALVRHDRAHHRRFLAGSDVGKQKLTFFGGNETLQIPELGYLYYVFVELGTPNVTMLVALDTGSFLFWVPCDCSECSSSAISKDKNIELGIYSPSLSTTSEKVSCNSSLCKLQSQCSNGTSSCPFATLYADNSSSLGVLVKDILYLEAEASIQRVVKAPITFGCAEVLSGSFLTSPIPYGIFGLGINELAVPTMLSNEGLSSNSFSMCFGSDGTGRINFGDKGSSDQDETPFIINGKRPYYNISISGIQVGNSSISTEFNALVDSGTSFTLLVDPVYTEISKSFNEQLSQKLRANNPNLIFENCYTLSVNQTPPFISINLTTKGGGNFPVNDPYIIIESPQSQYFCLAVLRSNLNIIGENFMRGLKIVFDRERMMLGWKNFNCYDVENLSTLEPDSPTQSPAAYAPTSYTPKATQGESNSTQLVFNSPSPSSHSSSHSMHIDLLNCVLTVLLLVLLGAT